MSSSAILIVSSSAAALQTRGFLSPPVGAKDCSWCSTEAGGVHHQAAPGFDSKAVVSLLWAGKSNGSTRANRSTAAKAGLGRYSGAIHGNSKGKSRSRRGAPEQQNKYDESCDQHQEGDSGTGDNLTTQSQEESGESTTEGAACEAFAAAEGVIDEDGSFDGIVDGSQRLSYNRYLLEMGVSPRSVQGDSESKRRSRDSLRSVHGMHHESTSDDEAPQLADEGHPPENGALSQGDSEAGGPGGDLDEGTKDLTTQGPTDAKIGSENFPEKLDFVPENETKSENGSIFVDKTSPAVFPSPDHVPTASSLNEREDKAFGNDGQNRETERRSKKLRSVSDGRPIEKKRRRKLESKAAVDSSLQLEERGDNERVRASSGEAERPAIPSDKGLEEFPAMIGSVTALKETEKFEPKVEFETDEAPDKEARGKSSTAVFLEAESADRDGQSSLALESVVDSNSTNDTSDEDKSPDTPNVDDTPLNVLSKVGPAIISVPSVAADETEGLMLSRIESVVGEQPAQVGSQVGETVLEHAVKVVPIEIVEHTVETVSQVASKVVEFPVVVVEKAAQAGSQVVDILPDVVTEQVGQVVEQVSDFAEQVGQVVDHVSDFAEQVGQVVDVVSDVAEQVANTVNEQVEHVAESVSSTASQVAEQVSSGVDTVTSTASAVADQVAEQVTSGVDTVTSTASAVVDQVAEQVTSGVDTVTSTASAVVDQMAEQVTSGVDTVSSTASAVVDQVTEFFSSDDDDESDSDDEFEAYVTSDLPEFRGRQGLDNFIVKQEDQGVLSKIYDLYTYMLKQSFPKFAAAMFCTPILVSGVFTLLYLPEFEGLAFDDTARDFFAATGGDSMELHVSWRTLFQVFMFSLSLSTGLQPELAPLSPYTLVVANLNALVAQLVFVFLSGAVFARLSQPSQPLQCSSVALVSSSPAQRKRKENAIKVFMARYVLSGPQPCELVDVKVDLTYKYNTLTRTGSFFRATQSLKLVRPEIAFLTHGMLVRHVIDETSPLYQRTPEMLNKEDAVFCLSVVGLERASMQSVFHVQHYCMVDKDVVWDAEFEDIILINKKNRRVVDHSRLSMWRPVTR